MRTLRTLSPFVFRSIAENSGEIPLRSPMSDTSLVGGPPSHQGEGDPHVDDSRMRLFGLSPKQPEQAPKEPPHAASLQVETLVGSRWTGARYGR